MFKGEIQVYRGKALKTHLVAGTSTRDKPAVHLHPSMENAVLAFPLHPQKVPEVPWVPGCVQVGELPSDASLDEGRPFLFTVVPKLPEDGQVSVGG